MRKVNDARSKRAAKRVLRRALVQIKEKFRGAHTHGMHKLNKAITTEKKKLVKAAPKAKYTKAKHGKGKTRNHA
jgi:hypothetical protein